MYQILIADDHPMIREAISRAIAESIPDCRVDETDSLEGAMIYASEHPETDLVLLDLNMPGMDGLNGIVGMRNEHPDIPVAVLSAEEDKNVVLKAVTYGAIGFIAKSMSRDKICEALAQILDGQVYLPPDIIRQTDQTPRRRSSFTDPSIDPDVIATFTRRQLLVFQHMAQGKSNKEIGYDLNIAETTVKAHVSGILRKLKVHSRLKAILCAKDFNFDQYLHR